MGDFNAFRKELNKSFSASQPTASNSLDNGSFLPMGPQSNEKMPLTPRVPAVNNENNKAKNKRTGSTKPKARPQNLRLEPQVKQEEFAKKQVADQRKAYKGHSKRTEPKKSQYRHPSSLGTPLEPKTSG